jgi:hypothetical protein
MCRGRIDQKPMPPETRLLHVTAPHFCAGAVWQHLRTGWTCIEAAPILKWMIGKSPLETHLYLQRKGWKYEWT